MKGIGKSRGSFLVQLRDDMSLRHSLLALFTACTTVHIGRLVFPMLFGTTTILGTDGVPLLFVYLILLLLGSILLPICLYGWHSRWNALQAALLGALFTLATPFTFGVTDADSDALKLVARYVQCMCVFHYGEYLCTALTARSKLTDSSYLLDHSYAYWLAALAGWLEFGLEYNLWPQLKQSAPSTLGLILAFAGDALRKRAMFDASGGFTHVIATRREPRHELSTSGVYALVRHPGYLGWLIWSSATQLVLCNPICGLAYIWLAWQFFNERIEHEERYLRAFFGQKYITYQRRVPLGIPFIRGYPPDQLATASSSSEFMDDD